jgi:hypothetical protein
MWEKVLWNYLKERLPGNVYCIDKNITGDSGNFEKNANLYLQKHHSDTDIIIQNATFISKMDNHIPTICYLQDDIRKMWQNTLLQEEKLKKSTTIIVNSVYTQKSYSEYTSDIIPIWVNQELFKKYDSKVLRGKYNIPQGNVGIFVWSLSETKWWEEIKSIIQTHSRVDHWMIVTKYEEHLQLKNASLFTQVTQETLSELLNCATFFIVWSKVETQCLAAIEAALCDIPLIMRDIWIFQEFSKEDKKMLWEFGDDFAKSIDILLDNKEKYSPRKRIIDKNLDIPWMIEKWIIVISRFLMLERSYEYLWTQNELKQSNIWQKIEIYIRKKILSPIWLWTFSFLRITNINFYKQALYKLLVKAKLYK